MNQASHAGTQFQFGHSDRCLLTRPNSKELKRKACRNLYTVLSPITFRVGERATTETYWPQPESRRTCAWTTKSSVEMCMLAVVHTIRCPSIRWKATWRYVAVMSMEFQGVWEALLGQLKMTENISKSLHRIWNRARGFKRHKGIQQGSDHGSQS